MQQVRSLYMSMFEHFVSSQLRVARCVCLNKDWTKRVHAQLKTTVCLYLHVYRIVLLLDKQQDLYAHICTRRAELND